MPSASRNTRSRISINIWNSWKRRSSNGGRVHWAATAADARQIVLDIAKQANCRRVVKSKSMTTEEIHLNPALEAAGLEVTETDFGEFIIQLAGERPSHLVAPAVHHTREHRRTFANPHRRLRRRRSWLTGKTRSSAAAREVRRGRPGHQRRQLRGRRDGHDRDRLERRQRAPHNDLPARSRRRHGHGKVLPRLDRLAGVSEIAGPAPRRGQTLSVYTTLISGPRRAGDRDGPEEFHLVLLDNGRSRVLATPFRESLQCIRCGACLNACPVYRRIGGHAYGGVYSGPIGSILTPLYDSVAENPHLPHASSLCGACQAACPVKINIPHMLIGLREMQHHPQRQPASKMRHTISPERLAYVVWREVLKRPWLYRLALRLSRWLVRPLASDGWLKKLPGPGAGWTEARDFPAPAPRSFRERWASGAC